MIAPTCVGISCARVVHHQRLVLRVHELRERVVVHVTGAVSKVGRLGKEFVNVLVGHGLARTLHDLTELIQGNGPRSLLVEVEEGLLKLLCLVALE